MVTRALTDDSVFATIRAHFNYSITHSVLYNRSQNEMFV